MVDILDLIKNKTKMDSLIKVEQDGILVVQRVMVLLRLKILSNLMVDIINMVL
jgi:hypothetical protein